jgi:multiple sugar transport system permease protein
MTSDRGPGILRRGAVAVALSAVAGAFALPLWWMFVASTRPAGLPPARTIEWLPHVAGWTNYVELFRLVPAARYLANSLLVEAIAVPASVAIASLAGFAILFAPDRWRRALVSIAILTMLVPSTALGLTRFLVLKRLGLIDSPLALAAPALAATNSFYVLLFFWAFRRIPRELFEAARLEGAGFLALWARIALPLSRPAVVAVSILSFSWYWSDLAAPLLYLKSEQRYTLPVGIEMLRQMNSIHWPYLMAGCVIMVLPVLVMFASLQRALGFEGRLFGSFMRGPREAADSGASSATTANGRTST